MTNTILGVVAAILVLGGLIYIARPDARNNAAAPTQNTARLPDGQEALIVEEANNYDFGTISMAAGVVTREFRIKNSGNEPVTINKMYTSCMCTTATLSVGEKRLGPFGMPGHGTVPRIDQAINPNEEAVVAVVFDPAAHGPAGVGRIQRVVTIENSAGRPIELSFAAMVTP